MLSAGAEQGSIYIVCILKANNRSTCGLLLLRTLSNYLLLVHYIKNKCIFLIIQLGILGDKLPSYIYLTLISIR